MSRDRAELGLFLRARRDALSPAQAGIEAFPGARRVPGLRRDELAVLAGLSPDYYARVEQGRQANVSAEVLHALARALRLDPTETAHLHDLARPTRTASFAAQPAGAAHLARPTAPGPPQRADPGLLRVMDSLGHVPVLLLGHRGEVLARNALLAAVLGPQVQPGSSFPRFLLLDPLARERIVNWSVFAEGAVAGLRREAGRRPDDVRLRALIDELRAADPDVAGWWEDHRVRDLASVEKHLRHPTAGDLRFTIEALSAPWEPGQHLVVYTVEPDSPTARVLPLLSAWAAEATPAA